MNFAYTEEEAALGNQARRLLAERVPSSLVRAMLDGERVGESEAVWRDVSKLGWPAIAIAEGDGGIGFGRVALCVLAEEIGRALAPLPMLPSIYIVADAIGAFGTLEQRATWLPGLASGEIIGTASLDPVAPTLYMNDGRLHGAAEVVPFALNAAVAIVSAREGETAGLFLVDLVQSGVTRTALHTIDDSRPHARLDFAGVAAQRLGNSELLVERLLMRAAVPTAFEQLGGADACLEMACAFVKDRKSFGRPVGSYQAVKHRLADMYVNNEIARSNAYYAAWALAADAPELSLAAAAARVSATEAYEFAAAETIQLHGGIGFTWEADCHLHYRRSRMLAQALEPIAWWRDRLALALDGAETR